MRLERIERDDNIFVDVLQCQDQPDLKHAALTCRMVDVSGNGMKMASGMHIPVDTVLGLRVDFPSHLYRLQGQVRWVRDDNEHYVGVLLDDVESPDIDAWTRLFDLDPPEPT